MTCSPGGRLSRRGGSCWSVRSRHGESCPPALRRRDPAHGAHRVSLAAPVPALGVRRRRAGALRGRPDPHLRRGPHPRPVGLRGRQGLLGRAGRGLLDPLPARPLRAPAALGEALPHPGRLRLPRVPAPARAARGRAPGARPRPLVPAHALRHRGALGRGDTRDARDHRVHPAEGVGRGDAPRGLDVAPGHRRRPADPGQEQRELRRRAAGPHRGAPPGLRRRDPAQPRGPGRRGHRGLRGRPRGRPGRRAAVRRRAPSTA